MQCGSEAGLQAVTPPGVTNCNPLVLDQGQAAPEPLAFSTTQLMNVLLPFLG